MLSAADLKIANAPAKPADPRTIICPVTGRAIGLWTGKVVSK